MNAAYENLPDSIPLVTQKRFWRKVNKNGPLPDQSKYPGLGRCWNWNGSRNNNGYGVIRIRYKLFLAHRAAYRILVGEIPKGLNVIHSCDNRTCTNPDHLRVGTQQENIAEAAARGRMGIAKGNRHGKSKLTEANVIQIRKERASGMLIKDIAAKYFVREQTIGQIANRSRWKWLT